MQIGKLQRQRRGPFPATAAPEGGGTLTPSGWEDNSSNSGHSFLVVSVVSQVCSLAGSVTKDLRAISTFGENLKSYEKDGKLGSF